MNICDKEIEYLVGKEEILNKVVVLWEKLNMHHERKSQHFKERFRDFTFKDRMDKILTNPNLEDIRVEVAIINEKVVGYCISSIIKDAIGEVESLYILPEYRGYKIGEKMMENAIKWLDENSVKTKKIKVAAGNEDVMSFYKKYRFFPESITLKQI